jgi:hypothetical protein
MMTAARAAIRALLIQSSLNTHIWLVLIPDLDLKKNGIRAATSVLRSRQFVQGFSLREGYA